MEEPAVALVDKGEVEALDLPPGFRFHPTDLEIIIGYLTEKVLNINFIAPTVGEVDLNKCEPWDCPCRARMGEKEWYFFCQIDRRMNRATEAGYWKAIGKDREIYGGDNLVGMKKTLVFHRGRAPKGEKTNWVMHEFRLEGKFATYWAVKDEWVVCKIFQKNTDIKKIPELLGINSQRSSPGFFSITLMDPSFSNADHQLGYSGSDVFKVGNQHPSSDDDYPYQVEQDCWNYEMMIPSYCTDDANSNNFLS